jgi:putative transposase
MIVAESQLTSLSERAICQTLAINRATFRHCRSRNTFVGPLAAKKIRLSRPVNALSEHECNTVLSTLNNDEFCDQPPSQAYFTLLSRGQYLCSISTMHRLLRRVNQQGERRHQRKP